MTSRKDVIWNHKVAVMASCDSVSRQVCCETGRKLARWPGKKAFHKGNCLTGPERRQNRAFRGPVNFLVALTCALALSGGGVSSRTQEAGSNSSPMPAVESRSQQVRPGRTLSKNDRSSVIAVALHSKSVPHTQRDCSHLVHSIYESAGFPYPYADSEDLYDGARGFLRVERPQPADLVVWHGHVGIVIRPSGHEFFSMLRAGPGIDDYRSPYWKGR